MFESFVSTRITLTSKKPDELAYDKARADLAAAHEKGQVTSSEFSEFYFASRMNYEQGTISDQQFDKDLKTLNDCDFSKLENPEYKKAMKLKVDQIDSAIALRGADTYLQELQELQHDNPQGIRFEHLFLPIHAAYKANRAGCLDTGSTLAMYQRIKEFDVKEEELRNRIAKEVDRYTPLITAKPSNP